MSMNGRRNKLALNLRPSSGPNGLANGTATSLANGLPNGVPLTRRGSADMLAAPEKPLPPPPTAEDGGDFPPPPEEAQRLISNLLPRSVDNLPR